MSRLNSDNRTAFALDGIGYGFQGSNQDTACRFLFQISDGGLNFRQHRAFPELSLGEKLFCFGDGQSVQGLLIRSIVILIHTGITGEDNQFIGKQVSCQFTGNRIFLYDCRGAF